MNFRKIQWIWILLLGAEASQGGTVVAHKVVYKDLNSSLHYPLKPMEKTIDPEAIIGKKGSRKENNVSRKNAALKSLESQHD